MKWILFGVPLDDYYFELVQKMSRDHIMFPPQQQQIRYLQASSSPATQVYSDYGLAVPSSQMKRSLGDSDLVIFNGTVQEREMLSPAERSPNQSQTFKLPKSNSQKTLPIIYNAYNDKNQENYQTRFVSKPNLNQNTLPQTIKNQVDPQFEENNSDVMQYRSSESRREQMYETDTHGFQTFNYLPAEGQQQPQTAHFLQIPSDHSDSHQVMYQNAEMQKSSPKYQPFQTIEVERHSGNPPQSKSRSRVIFQGNPPPLSPRVNIQPLQQGFPPPPSLDYSSKLIQIPQQQYQRFIDHLPMCKQSQDEILRLTRKSEQMGQKQHFYWQQNMTLRQQNKRLRDLVTHFQKRQKQLLKQREDFKQQCGNLVKRYREGLLQQFGLLFERYKLEMQRSK